MTYDIACQYLKNLSRRLSKNFPQQHQLLELLNRTTFAVPKLHVAGHKYDCQYRYSLNYIDGAGRMAGELIETAWAEANNIGPSTREMNPGHRHDVLNDFYGDWNWRKVQRMGTPSNLLPGSSYSNNFNSPAKSLGAHLAEALRFAAEKEEHFNGLTYVFRNSIDKWCNLPTLPEVIDGEWESVYRPKRFNSK